MKEEVEDYEAVPCPKCGGKVKADKVSEEETDYWCTKCHTWCGTCYHDKGKPERCVIPNRRVME